MKHRLPFSNLVIEPSPAVMPSNEEALPYSIVSFDYWNARSGGYGPIFKTFADRNWRIPSLETNYKSNKEQESGPDTEEFGVFLKSVPRGSNESRGIYIGVVQSGLPDLISENSDYYEYTIPCSYQIGIGDCDVKHRPWKDLTINFEGEIVERITTYYGNQQDDWEFISQSESPMTYGIPQTITLTEDMFDTEPELTVYPTRLGGIGPQYVTGYGEKEVQYAIGESGDIYQTVGAPKTFWTLGESAYYDWNVFVSYDNENNLVTVTEHFFKNLWINELNPASAYEPPTP
jgi:hypothetical protein